MCLLCVDRESWEIKETRGCQVTMVQREAVDLKVLTEIPVTLDYR